MGIPMMVWQAGMDGTGPLEKVYSSVEACSLDEMISRLPEGGYTTFRTFNHFGILRLADHYERLEETAQLAGKPVRIDREALSTSLHRVLANYPSQEARVRILVDLSVHTGMVYLMAEELHTPSLKDYEEGTRVLTRSMQRDNPLAKLTRFIETASAVRSDIPEGMGEVLMIGRDGVILEGLSSNFFAVIDGTIWTADQGVLSGITRSIVIEVIREKNIPLTLKGIHQNNLKQVAEAFITSASRDVLPVVEIDGEKVGQGVPGQITRSLLEGYRERVVKELTIV